LKTRKFHIANLFQTPVIEGFESKHYQILDGSVFKLEWKVRNAVAVFISHNVGLQAHEGYCTLAANFSAPEIEIKALSLKGIQKKTIKLAIRAIHRERINFQPVETFESLRHNDVVFIEPQCRHLFVQSHREAELKEFENELNNDIFEQIEQHIEKELTKQLNTQNHV